jgi:hypothetical protein
MGYFAGNTVHASRHASGGTDPVLPGAIGAEPARATASQVEMEAGIESAVRSMSPLRVAQAIAALGGGGGAVDGGHPDSEYGGTTAVDGGVP